MEVKLFGRKANVELIIISIIIGMILCSFTLCSCVGMKKENFSMGAPLNYNLGEGVPMNNWSQPNTSGDVPESAMYASLENNVGGTVPLPPNQLSFFSDTKFDASCCYKPQQYSTSNGCACMSPKQMKYLSNRGGNNTLPTYSN